jgi:hypothetical protein
MYKFKIPYLALAKRDFCFFGRGIKPKKPIASPDVIGFLIFQLKKGTPQYEIVFLTSIPYHIFSALPSSTQRDHALLYVCTFFVGCPFLSTTGLP